MERERDHSPEQDWWRTRAIIKLGMFAVRQAKNSLESLIGKKERFTNNWWQQKRESAEVFMAERRAQSGAILLVIAAQHPLVDKRTPNEEFIARLQAGAARANELAAEGYTVEMYIPGSRHMDNGIIDDITLSEAGATWLDENGKLAAEITVNGNNLNDRYKGNDGVYNSGDEAFVGASYFKEKPTFSDIEVFVGPMQAERWELHSIANGIAPIMHPITPESGETYHGALSATEKKWCVTPNILIQPGKVATVLWPILQDCCVARQ